MNRKKWFLLFVILTFFNIQLFSQAKDRITKIVIDAGHGGEDPGAVGSKSKEKDINLAVALQLGKIIKENFPDVEVYYTRKTDVFVPLYQRSKIANDKHADLFISLHCNASDNKSANGVETFVMGLHKTESNMEVARKENAAMLLEKDYESNYGDFNPNSPESYIIFSLYASAYLSNSALFASKVQHNLVKITRFRDRQVQQAGFWVLHKVAMPSILIELGFISNKEEEKVLSSPTSQKSIATSICNAFIEYKNQIEGLHKQTLPVDKIGQESKPDEPKEPVIPEVKPDSTQFANAPANTDVRFRVQFYSSPKELPLSDKKFTGLKNVGKYYEQSTWKYTVGNEPTYDAIQTILVETKKKFPDAFIIAFAGDKKIPVSDARKMIKNDGAK